MRMTTPLMIAAALAVSGPALAQDANNTAEAAAPVDANATAPVADANAVAPANDVAAAPVEESAPADTYGDTTPAPKKSGFPWGVLGLLGLLGLIPRRGR
jgi:hypothetical protein